MTAVMANGNWDPGKYTYLSKMPHFLVVVNRFIIKNYILALSRLLSSLEEARQVLPSSEEEFGFLSDLLQSRELHALVKVHNKILNNGKDEKFHPTLSNSMQIALEVLDLVAPRATVSGDCKEIFILLQRPHIQVYLIFVVKLLYMPSTACCLKCKRSSVINSRHVKILV